MIGPFTGKWGFLSNFWPCSIQLDGKTYPTVEHAFQAAKTNNQQDRAMIAVALTPGKAKRLGRTVLAHSNWPNVRLEIMKALVLQKFMNNLYLTKRLLATEDEELIEVNTWGDRFWGQCPVGHGANTLGKVLMGVREFLRDRNEQSS